MAKVNGQSQVGQSQVGKGSVSHSQESGCKGLKYKTESNR